MASKEEMVLLSLTATRTEVRTAEGSQLPKRQGLYVLGGDRGGHDCPRGRDYTYAPGGDRGDRSVLCWQLYNFLLECHRKTNAPGKQLLQEGWQNLRRTIPASERCLPPSETLLDTIPRTATTQRPPHSAGRLAHPADSSCSTVLSFF